MTFQKNNAGKKPGTLNRDRTYLRSRSDELQEEMVKRALGGSMAALKMCADRLWPKLRPQAAPVQLDAVSLKLADKGSAIVDAALSGALSPDTARDLLSSLADVARLKELTELEDRLQALENRKDAAPWIQRSEPKLPVRRKRRELH